MSAFDENTNNLQNSSQTGHLISDEHVASRFEYEFCPICGNRTMLKDGVCTTCNFNDATGLAPTTIVGLWRLGQEGMYCAKCGTDLHGLHDLKCPKCGTHIHSKPPQFDEPYRVPLSVYRWPAVITTTAIGILTWHIGTEEGWQSLFIRFAMAVMVTIIAWFINRPYMKDKWLLEEPFTLTLSRIAAIAFVMENAWPPFDPAVIQDSRVITGAFFACSLLLAGWIHRRFFDLDRWQPDVPYWVMIAVFFAVHIVWMAHVILG